MTAVTFFRPVAARRESGLLSLLAILRPFVLLSALAFFAGFGGYLILGPPHVLSGAPGAPAAVADTPSPTPAVDAVTPDWDPPRHV